MADPSWLDKNNITSVRLKTSTGTVEIGQLEAFGLFGQTFLVILYSLSTFFALTGNTLVILVEIYGRRSARNLQKFLINLAISDLLLGVLVTPFIYTDIMLGRWIFHPLLCPVTQFVQLMSVFVTTYTLTFIGIERYFATLHPLSSANTWLRSHGNLVLQLSWIFGSILASFSIQNTRVVAFNYNSQTYYDCANWVDVAERDMQIYVTLSFVLTFVLPIIFLTISYGAIGRRLMRTQKYWCSYRQTIPFSSHHHSHSHHSHNQNSTSRTHSNNNSNSSHNHNLSNVDNEGNNNNNNNPTVTAAVAAPSVTTTTTRKNKSLIRKNFTKISKLSNSNVHHQTNGGNGNDDNNTTTVTTSNNSLNKKSNNKNQNKVIVRFDKRNAEFLNKMRVFRLLVAVLVLFIICWLPIKIFMLILAFRPSIVYLDSMTNYYIYYISFFLCHWLSMANSFANPILYCFMSKSFRI
ncbi:hypothetical protein DERP_004690 [Dermatophagoides pteronyssinus]|uniref:G-protein coupled receptors family 1 profile domain-containing protein n=1 Tax=Dermatophagoides pteronyssinus TaxID=6956 RepID=A0ABQ8JPG7_DERPT|nr:hypothetical protein DERP_004690 [Dermatophagoides pteronyssinus]